MARMARQSHTKLPLKKDGDWILVRDRLNVGERSAFYGKVYKGTDAAGKADTDIAVVQQETVAAHVVDWHLTYEDGTTMSSPLTGGLEGGQMSPAEILSFINNMDVDDFDEIYALVDGNNKTQAAKREAEKNEKAGARDEAPSSPLPSGGASPSSTSES